MIDEIIKVDDKTEDENIVTDTTDINTDTDEIVIRDKYVGICYNIMNKIAYSALMDHEKRFGNVFNTNKFFMKYLMLFHTKFSMDDNYEKRIRHPEEDYQFLKRPIYHTDDITYYILLLDNPYIHYKDLEYDKIVNDLLDKTHDRLYVIYTNEAVRTYINQNYNDVKLILSTYAHHHDYDKMISLINDSKVYGVCIDMDHLDVCSRFMDDKIDPKHLFLLCDWDVCTHCEGFRRCVRWKSRHTLPVKHYVDYVTPMWEYRPKFSKCYSNMNKNDIEIDVRSMISGISERFGIENFLLNQYNNGISDVVDLFASDEWRDKVICQKQEKE